MTIDSKQIQHLSQLARLKSDPQSDAIYAEKLSSILNLIEQMNAVDTENVTPMHHPQDAVLRLRADEVTSDNQREAFQALAPATENGLYLVPKVIE